jgi:tripartite ATP-independent transporter DctM subunit
MSWEIALLVYGIILIGCLLFGVAIGTAMGLVGIIGLTLLSGTLVWPSFGDIVFNTLTNFTLVSVPLFLLMGEIILTSGLSRRFYDGVSILLSPVPGALAYSNVVGCAMFSALCGSSVATAMTVGTVALPEMRRRGYADRLTVGSLAGGGCLGILIPPSIPIVVYGGMTNESVIDLFVAGVIPGVALAGLFLVYIAVWSIFNRDRVPNDKSPLTVSKGFWALVNCVPVAGLVLLIFFSMYFGVVTPTEAAALGCLLALLLALAYRQITRQTVWEALERTVVTTCVVLFITINAQFLSFAVVHAGIGRGIATAMVESNVSPFVFFCFLFLLYLVLGMFLDGLSLMLLTVPIVYAAMMAMGFNGIWLGIIMVVFIELGALTPPMGLNLFAIQSISQGMPLGEVALGSLPFALIISAFSFLLYFFPEIALFLPQTMRAM